jgi:hypothetical protein
MVKERVMVGLAAKLELSTIVVIFALANAVVNSAALLTVATVELPPPVGVPETLFPPTLAEMPLATVRSVMGDSMVTPVALIIPLAMGRLPDK